MENLVEYKKLERRKAKVEKQLKCENISKEDREEFLAEIEDIDGLLKVLEEKSEYVKDYISKKEKEIQTNSIEKESIKEDAIVDKKENKEDNEDNVKRSVVIAFLFLLLFSVILIPISIQEGKQRKEEAKQEAARVAKERKAQLELDSILKIKAAEKLNEIKTGSIKITSCYLTRPNSANGCDVIFYYRNKSKKTIKYLCFEGDVYNAVGDVVPCEIRGYRSIRCRSTGPVKPGASNGGHWGCVVYNSTARKFVLTEIDIEYTDGSKLNIKGDELKYVK